MRFFDKHAFTLFLAFSATTGHERTSAAQVTVASGISGGQIVSRVAPQYPPEAKAAGVSGLVLLHATITPTGDVIDVSVLSGPPLLQKAAIAAVRQWKYSPYVLSGTATQVDTTVTVVFTLPAPVTAEPTVAAGTGGQGMKSVAAPVQLQPSAPTAESDQEFANRMAASAPLPPSAPAAESAQEFANRMAAFAPAGGGTSAATGTADRIAQLRQEIQADEQRANTLENSANELASGSNCSGTGAAMCQMIGNMGAARQRKEANEAQNEADQDRESIQHLMGEDVQAGQRRSTSFGDTSTQAIQDHPTQTINETLTAQQRALRDTAARQDKLQQEHEIKTRTGESAMTQARAHIIEPSAPNASPSRATENATISAPPASEVIAPSSSDTQFRYAEPASHCITAFYDPNFYNWYSYKNACPNAVSVTYISRVGLHSGTVEIKPEGQQSTGWSKTEVNSWGGFEAYACPLHYIPVDKDNKLVTFIVGEYRCKYRGY